MRFPRVPPQALWCISAVLATMAATVALTRGNAATAVVLAVWAVVSLYGAVDHVVEPVFAELLDQSRLRPVAADDSPPAELSARQRRVLRLLAYGLPDEEIAELVDVDEATVAHDVEVILGHLGVARRADAMEVAHRSGIVVAAGPKVRDARPAA